MIKTAVLILFALALLSFEYTLLGQTAPDPTTTSSKTLRSQQALSSLASLTPLGIVPALAFPTCKSPSGLVVMMTAGDTHDPGAGESEAMSSATMRAETNTSPPEARPQTLIVFPLTKQGIASTPCAVQDAKSGLYEPAPGSPLSAYPLV